MLNFMIIMRDSMQMLVFAYIIILTSHRLLVLSWRQPWTPPSKSTKLWLLKNLLPLVHLFIMRDSMQMLVFAYIIILTSHRLLVLS